VFNKATCFDPLGHHHADTRTLNARHGLIYLLLRRDLVNSIPIHLISLTLTKVSFPKMSFDILSQPLLLLMTVNVTLFCQLFTAEVQRLGTLISMLWHTRGDVRENRNTMKKYCSRYS